MRRFAERQFLANLNGAVTRKEKGTVALAIARHRGDVNGIINELFLASLNRKPTAEQLTHVKTSFPMFRGQRDKEAAAPFQDLFWALLNSNEFILNH